MSGGSRRTRLLVPGVVVLLVLVAIAASGATPTGSGGSRRPSEWFLDVFASLVLVAMAIGTVLLVVLVILRPQEILDQVASGERRRGRATVTLSFVAAALVVALAIRRFVGTDGASGVGIDGGGVTGAGAGGGNRYEPAFATSAVAVVLGVVAFTLIAAFVVFRRGRTADDGASALLHEQVADVLGETLDDLRAERDPRRAVIAAYARLEQVFAAHGVPRRVSEAPQEYLERVLASLDVPERAASRLTELFATAKFSQHDVRPAMKDEAIDALETARDELRLAAEQARLGRARALSLARERAAT